MKARNKKRTISKSQSDRNGNENFELPDSRQMFRKILQLKFSRELICYSIVVFILVVTGCKKDSGSNNTSLLSQEWKISSLSGNSSTFGSNVGTLKFESDGDYFFHFDKIVGGWEEEEGKWNWENNEQTLEVTLFGSKIDWKIEKLTAKDFWFSEKSGALLKCVLN